MKFLAAAFSLVLLALQPASLQAAQKSAANDDTKAMVGEEKDRLAREKKDLEERAAQLTEQLETRRKLIEAQDAYIEDLEEELKALQRGR